VAALATLARIEWRRGRLAPARSLAEESLRLLESLRSAIASPELRATFLATQRQAYETEIGLLMDLDRDESGQGHAREAFAVSERARARALLDLLAAARLGARPGGAPDFQRRRQALDERLRAAASASDLVADDVKIRFDPPGQHLEATVSPSNGNDPGDLAGTWGADVKRWQP
jgi:hypothetical protein